MRVRVRVHVRVRVRVRVLMHTELNRVLPETTLSLR